MRTTDSKSMAEWVGTPRSRYGQMRARIPKTNDGTQQQGINMVVVGGAHPGTPGYRATEKKYCGTCCSDGKLGKACQGPKKQ